MDDSDSAFWIAWTISGLLAAIFVAANYYNLGLLLGKYRNARGRSPSPILFVGGLAGAAAMAIAPDEVVQPYFWIPPLVDIGTAPYLLVFVVLVLKRALTTREGLRSVPFVRYFVKPEPVTPRKPFPKERAIVGCILGTAVGDALGLACEGLSRRRQRKMFPDLDGYKLLPFGKGMCSDDTEHTCMLAQSLIETAHYRDPNRMGTRFAANFAWRLRFWLLGLPAGIGFATLRAILKLWLGFSPQWSGIYSAGNAPAMRIALVGVCYGDDVPRMCALVHAATRITHTDLKAQYGALAVALAAHFAATHAGRITPEEYLRALEPLCDENAGLLALIRSVAASVARGESAESYAATIGCARGVTGYIYHTVPVALHVWLRRPSDYRGALLESVRLGGDTDTVAAVVGALVGARAGKEGIPAEWLQNLCEWPRTTAWMEQLGVRLAGQVNRPDFVGAIPLSWLELLVRNLLFIPVVLARGFRRLLPPY